MKHAFDNYNQFRDISCAGITLPSGRIARLEHYTPEPNSYNSVVGGVAWGLRLKLDGEEFLKVFREDGTPIDTHAVISSKMVDAVLEHLVLAQMEHADPVEKELCKYLGENGSVKTFPELLALARHFADMEF